MVKRLGSVILVLVMIFAIFVPVQAAVSPEDCPHDKHDEHTLLCNECGTPIAHDYVDGKCTHCASKTNFIVTEVDPKWTAENEKAGTVVSHDYDTRAYVTEEKLGLTDVFTQKRMNVYLPYGYEEGAAAGKQYNVLYLLPGGMANEDFWLDKTAVKNLLDNMIAEGLIEPIIVAMPTYAYREGQFGGHEVTIDNPGDVDLLLDLFALELREYVIPFVESKYSTYADNANDIANLQATRSHRAMAGFSAGGGCTYISGLQNNLDIFSYFGIFSSSMGRYNHVLPLADILSDSEGYGIDYMYNGNGTKDSSYEYHLPYYFDWVATGAIDDNVNACLVVKPEMDHNNGTSGIADLYNALPMFFVTGKAGAGSNGLSTRDIIIIIAVVVVILAIAVFTLKHLSDKKKRKDQV